MRAALILVLALAGCRAAPEPHAGLVTPGIWAVTQIDGRQAVGEPMGDEAHPEGVPLWALSPGQPWIRLEQDGGGPVRVSGFSGCNWFGRDIASDDQLVESTAIGCDAVMEQETALFSILSGTPEFSFDMDAGVMEITGDGGIVRAELVDRAHPGLAGRWTVARIDGASLPGDHPAIALAIGARIEMRSQCIGMAWEYDATWRELRTRRDWPRDEAGREVATCERGLTAEEDRFATVMDGATDYALDPGSGALRLSSGSGEIMLSPDPS